ncbi:MerR family transcriptional regulator [Phytohabitans sp. LJ34]|uniref:MerR family transcriptional regulator n=1 Tax=Phytohabitans sp. LJ34 TaxID=3452217 RepID=UPI003F89A94A
MNGSGMRSGELAQAAGVNIQTLRYYERRGLLAQPMRSPGGHRSYPPEAVSLLRIIKAAQRLGFTLDEVSDLLEAGRRRHASGALRERALAKLEEMDQKIAHLSAIRDALAEVLEARCDGLTNCTCPNGSIPFADLGRISAEI